MPAHGLSISAKNQTLLQQNLKKFGNIGRRDREWRGGAGGARPGAGRAGCLEQGALRPGKIQICTGRLQGMARRLLGHARGRDSSRTAGSNCLIRHCHRPKPLPATG